MSTKAIEDEAENYLKQLHLNPNTMVKKNQNLENLESIEAGSYHLLKDLMAGFHLRMNKKG